ncbi:hypothetical protein RJT34_30624 [Clitoria ternatea]|uniref:Uncharacterized protein n=1 Tax=Clitoria ternatea TaxID=43366 RepID=A0AAN9EXC0_CLITE
MVAHLLTTIWYTNFGSANPRRLAEDLAFAVARFIQNGGSFVNYYMKGKRCLRALHPFILLSSKRFAYSGADP